MSDTSIEEDTINIWQLRDNLILKPNIKPYTKSGRNEFPTNDQCFDFLYKKVVKLQNDHRAHIARLNMLEEKIATLTKECTQDNI